jgi:hypothetical protein
MGERGKNEEMKNPRTNHAPLEQDKPEADRPEADKPEILNSMDSPATTPHKPDVRLGREAQARIGQQLRAMYDDFANQGVPQNITDLVRRLSEQD